MAEKEEEEEVAEAATKEEVIASGAATPEDGAGGCFPKPGKPRSHRFCAAEPISRSRPHRPVASAGSDRVPGLRVHAPPA